MDIQHKRENGQLIFYTQLEEGKGEMVCSLRDGALVIEHTGVDEALRGQHVGDALVKAGLAYAKAHDLEVIPVCVFAKKVIERK